MDFLEELSHHGTLDQKWGFRNYQYPNGSLTPLGRIHYGVGPPRSDAMGTSDATANILSANSDKNISDLHSSATSVGKEYASSKSDVEIKSKTATSGKDSKKTESKPAEEQKPDAAKNKDQEMQEAVKRHNLEKQYEKIGSREEAMRDYINQRNLQKQYDQLKKEEAGPSLTEQTKKALEDASRMIEQAKKSNQEYIKAHTGKKTLDLSKMSNQELQDAINRGRLESQYNEMFAPTVTNVSAGKKALSNILEYAGPILATATSAVTLASLINQYKKSKT